MSTDEIKERLSATHLHEISSRTNKARHNHSTLALHQASENGDLTEVRNILAEGTADLNALMPGHRALRTALHKASAYGHTNVVKLLLKAGADADKMSSVQRTALHEACTGGHLETLLELVQYTKDVNHADSHGQTAAHSAAYHGETACLNVLIHNGCDVNYQDNQMCTPSHLAVKKNYPETLKCLLDTSNVDILKADKEGRTSVHYAAIYGSASCLKVFKKSKVDLMTTDENGATPAHHAAAGCNLECLKFLTKIGISSQRRDNSGRTSLHYAAQKGSTECLHWLLEQGADASAMDDTGNTPAHCASSGHMPAMNCLVNHSCDMTIINHHGDTPDMLSRKYGHTLANQKAVNGEIQCPFCVEQRAQQEYAIKHKPSEVEQSIKFEEKVLFKPPIKTRSHAKSKQKGQLRQTSFKSTNNKRNLSTQYYGQHLFTMDEK